MNKNAKLTGQPIFSQLLNLIDNRIILESTLKHDSDKYYKKFKTKNHLITMLYAVFHKCTSLREVVTGMQICNKKLNHLGLTYSPRRSTLSEANFNRDSEVFETIYKKTHATYGEFLADSHSNQRWLSKIFIIDSTTISLFKEILKNAGSSSINGKRKGGVKVHAMINSSADAPCLIKMTAAAKHDAPFIKNLKLPAGSVVVFDKGYVDYKQYELWNTEKVTWVTRIRKGAIYSLIENNSISNYHRKFGILSDQQIVLGHTSHKNITRTKARLIKFFDKEKNITLEFITNSDDYKPTTITKIYKQRWQIELLFKRIKQNYPLQYFLGDNENAIKLQIWCVLIADLLTKVVQRKLKKSWSFSNLCSMMRIHLMTYIGLYDFLNNPDKLLINYDIQINKGPTLFD